MKYNIYFLMLFAVLLSCKGKSTDVEKKEEEVKITENTVTLTEAQLKNCNLEVGKIEEKGFFTTLKVNGKIDVPPQNLVSISAPLGGYLINTHLLPGSPIRKGELLATLQDPQFIQLQQDYLLAKSKLEFANLEYNRQKELSRNQATSTKLVQQALSEVEVQRINQNAIAEKLKQININPNNISASRFIKTSSIYSPINGYVSKVNVNIGKYVSPTEVLFELINPEDIHLNLKIFEKDMESLSIGKKLIAYSNSNTNLKYNCEIILISKDITTDGYGEVHCHFENMDKTLLPGMYMNAEIETFNTKTNVLPEDAIVSFEGKDYVFYQSNKNEFTMQEVQTNAAESGLVTIVNGKSIEGKNIVVKGAYTLLMKMKNVEE